MNQTSHTQPSLFVSHGAPSLPLENGPTTTFFKQLGQTFPKPQAILCISAHWYTDMPLVSSAPRMEMIYDFYGFPPELYEIKYPARGAPRLAEMVAGLIQNAGFTIDTDPTRGLDHGAWVPLSMMFPQADIPVFQLSVQPGESPDHHFRMGQALRTLRDENILILASGGATHNLSDFRGQSPDSIGIEYALQFDTWLKNAVITGDVDSILDYRKAAPEARRNHPTPEHFLPLLVALGAAGDQPAGKIIHDGFTYGMLSMAAFRWGE